MRGGKRAAIAAAAVAEVAANETRGEHELELAGTTYLLRPSFAAIKAMEKKTGKSLVMLARTVNLGDMNLDHVGIVAAELIKAGAAKDDLAAKVSSDRIAELCYEEGMPRVMARLTLCLADAAMGGRTVEGEARAVA